MGERTIGLVKIDVHKAEREFQNINLSQVDVIKGLIKYRFALDSYQDISQNVHFDSAGDVNPINQELIITYIDLDNLIEKCGFNVKQRFLLDKLMHGYSVEEVADIFKQSHQSMYKMFDKICERIAEQAYRDWKYEYIYSSVLPVPWNYKTCNKCGESLPVTEDFFGRDKKNKDGHKNKCKACQ